MNQAAAGDTTAGYLLDSWSQTRRGRTFFYAVGRLDSGETFGLIDDSVKPGFYLRLSDEGSARALLSSWRGRFLATRLTAMDGEPVLFLESPGLSDAGQARNILESNGLRTYEADVRFTTRYLLEKGITNSVLLSGVSRSSSVLTKVFESPRLSPGVFTPVLTALSFDLETTPDAGEILAVSLVVFSVGGVTHHEEILIQTQNPLPGLRSVEYCEDERSLLLRFTQRVREIDPDILTGWNIIDFDLKVLTRRSRALAVDLSLSRLRLNQEKRPYSQRRGGDLLIRGRQVLDAMTLVRFTLHHFDDYRLDTVSQAILGRGKTLQAEEWEAKADIIENTYHNDLASFAEYCLEDSRLVRDILTSENLLALTLRRSQMTGLPLERAWGSVEAFDLLYTLELRKKNRVAPTRGVDREEEFGAPGGLVLEPRPGLYQNIFVFDFKSLYPSIMRTFNIDPLGRTHATGGEVITAPNGVQFDRNPGILPRLLAELWRARDEAKQKKDALASYTCKIVMNSFYGVLGSPACRFGTRDLAEAITSFGHLLLTTTRSYLEAEGYSVLYGDTDSLFVDPHLPTGISTLDAMERGRTICGSANNFLSGFVKERYKVESILELEFEKFYSGLLLPLNRAGSGGRAKNYGGWREEAEGSASLEITGMEAVRSDWTELAGVLQQEIFHLLFTVREECLRRRAIEERVKQRIAALFAGELDAELVYRKRIRKPLEEYVRTTPPHVRAARLLPGPVRVVRYLITLAGPEPLGFLSAPIDYPHYLKKQILPIVQTIAPFCGLNSSRLCSHGEIQSSLFTEEE